MNSPVPAVKKREVKYDWLRAFAVLAIIAVHAMPVETHTPAQWWFNSILTPILLSFVGIYFMLSGLFILEKGTEDIARFYWNRFITIGIPFLVYVFIYYCYNVWADKMVLSPAGHIAEYLKEVVTAGVPRAGHMWFMYAIAAFYVCAPFLSRMFHNMTDQDLRLFLILMAMIQAADIWSEALGFSLRPSLQYILYTGWIYFFLLGYGLKRLCKYKHFPYIAVLGAVFLLFRVGIRFWLPQWEPQNPHRFLSTVFLCAAIFLMFEFYGQRLSGWLDPCISVISGYSYSIYLIHFLVLKYLVEPGLIKDMISRHYLAGIGYSILATFVLSLCAAVVVDSAVVKPLQRLARRIKLKR